MNLRIVADTNVIVSAVLNPKGKPAAILDAIIEGDLLLIVSDAVLEEIRNVFSYGKIEKLLQKRGIPKREINAFLESLTDISIFVPENIELDIIESDPADNKFLACAVEGNADFLVSGDHHLTELEKYKNIQILTPANFVNLVMSGFRG